MEIKLKEIITEKELKDLRKHYQKLLKYLDNDKVKATAFFIQCLKAGHNSKDWNEVVNSIAMEVTKNG